MTIFQYFKNRLIPVATIFCITVLVCPLTVTAGSVWGFVGIDSGTPGMFLDVELVDRNSDEVVDEETTNLFGKYSFSDVKPGKYYIRVGEAQRKVFVKSGEKRLDIDLSDPKGRMDYSKVGKSTGKHGSKGRHKDSGSLNSQIARDLAGSWWGYSGSTERSIGLCLDGTYFDSSESSYSGHGYDSGGNETMAWGNASQSGGQGNWSVEGDQNSGTIYVQYSNGNSSSLNYRARGDGCLNIDGSTMCKKSNACR